MKKQGRNYKCKFIYDEQCDEYDIQLVKRNYKWLWLLMLLLLFLLFIPLKKVLNVKVVDEADQPISSATVQFEYSPRFIVYNGAFFKKVRFFDEQTTDSVGVAKFGEIHYTLFSVVAQLLSRSNIIATAKGYNAEIASPYFHFKRDNDTIVIKMHKEEFVTLDFRTLDKEDYSLLPDVDLEIIVDGKPYDSIKNSGNGEFSIRVNAIHLVSIKATKQKYLPNEQIKNRRAKELFIANQKERDIVVEKIPEVTLEFRTFDEYDMSLLPDVTLSIEVNGKKYTAIKNSGNGEFSITLKPDDVISIHAEKQGYMPNDDINNRRAQDLFDADQSERDIIMKLPPCSANGDNNHKSANGSVLEYDMKKGRGTFLFQYYTDTAADHIIIYDCRKNDRNKSKIIFDVDEATGNQTKSLRLNFSSRVITVEVIGNTEWNYTVNCPD